jgi:hypothetical protein
LLATVGNSPEALGKQLALANNGGGKEGTFAVYRRR